MNERIEHYKRIRDAFVLREKKIDCNVDDSIEVDSDVADLSNEYS